MTSLLFMLLVACAPKLHPRPALEPDGWRARAEARQPALAQAFDDGLDPTGFWALDWQPGYDHTTLHVTPLEEGTVRLRFYRSWCLGRQFGETSARLDEGVLVLERALAPFGSEPLRRLVPVRVAAHECLVPDLFLANVGQSSPEPSQGRTNGWAFVRQDVSDPEGFHSRWQSGNHGAFTFGTAGLHFGTTGMQARSSEQER